MSSEMADAAQATMSLNVIYPNHEGAKFDMSYYRSTHIPMVMKVMSAASVILIEGVPMGNAPAPYAMIAHFQFPSAEALPGRGARDRGLRRLSMADAPQPSLLAPGCGRDQRRYSPRVAL